jgi:hypothetical protein
MEPLSTQAAPAESETVTVPVIAEHIGIRPGYCGGEPHILGHRIKVRQVAVWHEKDEMSPAELERARATRLSQTTLLSKGH